MLQIHIWLAFSIQTRLWVHSRWWRWKLRSSYWRCRTYDPTEDTLFQCFAQVTFQVTSEQQINSWVAQHLARNPFNCHERIRLDYAFWDTWRDPASLVILSFTIQGSFSYSVSAKESSRVKQRSPQICTSLNLRPFTLSTLVGVSFPRLCGWNIQICPQLR